MVRAASLLGHAFVCFVLVASFACSGSDHAPQPPGKIVLISIDTTRSDHLSGYGYRRETTPFLDRLARRGVRLANVYAPMPTTDPSHATMLTGQYPRTHGIMFNAGKRSRPDDASLGSWLQDRGYRTAAITARLGLDPRLRGIRGFDHTDAPELPARWRDASEILARVERWLDARGADERWFLWAHLWEPHKPYQPEEPYRRRFLDRSIAKRWIRPDPARFVADRKLVPPRVVEAATALYDGEIATADDAVARIIELVTSAAPAGVEPLILVVSDHGESLAERQETHGVAFGHGALIYDEVVKVPWITVWQDRLKPAVIETPVSLVDLTPTVIGLLGGAAPAAIEGRDLSRFLIAGSEPEDVPILVERRLFRSKTNQRLSFPETAWIEFPWKLIVNEGAAAPELYRLDTDPGERDDLAAGRPEIARALGEKLERWKRERPLLPAGGPISREQEQELRALRSLGYVE